MVDQQKQFLQGNGTPNICIPPFFFSDNDDDAGADDDNVVTNMPLAACFEWEQ